MNSRFHRCVGIGHAQGGESAVPEYPCVLVGIDIDQISNKRRFLPHPIENEGTEGSVDIRFASGSNPLSVEHAHGAAGSASIFSKKFRPAAYGETLVTIITGFALQRRKDPEAFF